MQAIPIPEKFECETYQECVDWFGLFQEFDTDNDGLIPVAALKGAVRASANQFGLTREEADVLVSNADTNGDRHVDFAEFTALMARAKKMRLRWVMVYAARSVLARNQQTEYVRYLLEYNCFPPPFFIVVISILQICLYIHQEFEYCGRQFQTANCEPGLNKSPFILDPCGKLHLWRYFTYMFVHVGYVHLLTNLAVQILLGIPLELVHKYWRVGLIYLIGVMCGALLFFATESKKVYLAGASGGVYTLLSAHIANVIINWGEMELNWVRASILGLFVSADVGVAVYQRYTNDTNRISYISHIGGFIAGLLLGILILRNLRKLEWERYAWWAALALLLLFVGACVTVIAIQPHAAFSYACSKAN